MDELVVILIQKAFNTLYFYQVLHHQSTAGIYTNYVS